MKIKNPLGATLLDDETLQGLIPGLTTQMELDEFEAEGIARATLWAQHSRFLSKNLLSATGLCRLHREMFKNTWQWAGKFRVRETNIGVAPEKIQNDLKILLDDVQYWLKHQTYSLEEIAVRFHHRLVWIHPFPNGNGRFSRLATDLFLKQQSQNPGSWGKENLGQMNEKRTTYISALKMADREENFNELLRFMLG